MHLGNLNRGSLTKYYIINNILKQSLKQKFDITLWLIQHYSAFFGVSPCCGVMALRLLQLENGPNLGFQVVYLYVIT